MHNVIVYDLTLAAPTGEPAFSPVEKTAVAQCLTQLGVDVIEVGAPGWSPADYAAARLICRDVAGPAIAARCDLEHGHIARTCEALAGAKQAIVQLLLRSDPMFYQYQPTLVQQEVLERVAASVAFACSHGVAVQLTVETAPRLESRFLARLLATAVAAGAGGVVLADTAGAALAAEIEQLVRLAKSATASHGTTVGVFCSNENGMAVANTLAAVAAGAGQVAASLSGLGPAAEGPYLDRLLPGLRRWCRSHTGLTPPEVTVASRRVAQLVVQSRARREAERHLGEAAVGRQE